MKKIFVMIALMLPMLASAEKFGRVNTQELVQGMPEIATMNAQLDSLNSQWENMLLSMQNEIQEKYTRYEQEAATLSDAQKQIRQEEIYAMQQRYQTTLQTAQQDLQQKQQELFVPIQEKVQNAIKEVGKQKNLTFVFEDGMMLYVSETEVVNITADVKARLGIR